MRLNKLIVTSLVFFSLSYSAYASVFYVDPSYNGGTKNGSQVAPWTTLDSNAWEEINNSLKTEEVYLYFSALKYDATSQESYNAYLEIKRYNNSNFRLTIDGSSYYNTNDSNGVWAKNPYNIDFAYKNNKVCKLLGNGSSALGWTRSSLYPKQDNITVRGFECTGKSSRVSFAGDNVFFEYLNIHDITSMGPALSILYTFPDSCSSISDRIFEECTNMIVRHVIIDTVFGEAFYIGSINPDCPASVQEEMGNEHSNITVEDVYINSPGNGGGQGDGIDVKNGVTDLTIRNCEIVGVTGMGGIILPQTMINIDQNILIENNYIHDSNNISSESRRAIYGVSSSGKYGYNGITVRNNIIANFYNGITFSGYDSALENVYILNNTIYQGDNEGLTVQSVDNSAKIINNVVIGNSESKKVALISGNGISSDNNIYYGIWGYSSEGTDSFSIIQSQRNLAFKDPDNGDFMPSETSILNKNAQILNNFFQTDFYSYDRNDEFWSVGAIERHPETPKNITIQQ